ncbi:MAG: hypothetical protein U0163_21820 [Gemmatimonadaceae bacterium]
MTAPTTIREYEVRAQSTDTFGRVLCNARQHHFIVDGPVQNGCPGEELTPPELFLSAVASCGVELIHVIGREQNIPVRRVSARIWAMLDRAKQPRTDVTLFNTVRLEFELSGADAAGAAALVEGFRRR